MNAPAAQAEPATPPEAQARLRGDDGVALRLAFNDRIPVPQRPAMVSVFDSVYNESAFVHRPEKTVTDYLEQAGGPKKEADRRNMFLLRAEGSVVPEDLYRTTLTKNLKDWTQIFFQFGLGATALKVIGD